MTADPHHIDNTAYLEEFGLARLLLTVSLCSSRREVQSGVEFVFDRALVADR